MKNQITFKRWKAHYYFVVVLSCLLFLASPPPSRGVIMAQYRFAYLTICPANLPVSIRFGVIYGNKIEVFDLWLYGQKII